MAGSSSEYLKTYDFNIIEEVDGQGIVMLLPFIFIKSKPYVIQFIFDLFETAGINKPRLYNRLDMNSGTDIVIVLGNDWANYVNQNRFPEENNLTQLDR